MTMRFAPVLYYLKIDDRPEQGYRGTDLTVPNRFAPHIFLKIDNRSVQG